MKKCIGILVIWGVLHTILSGQLNKITFEEYTLDNGLHVILHQDKSMPIVVVSVMVHVGSKNENPERTGFAHFFEHLLFEGSENIGRGEFDQYVEKAGGTLNANTSWDRTYYYEILPSNQLELGLWLESERLLHAKVDQRGIETQREVVKEEKRQRIDNQPYGRILQETMSRLFKEHPYRWPVIGSMEHLDAASEEDYQKFYSEFYVPNNAVLSIAGDLDIDQTKKWVEKYFGSIPGSTHKIFRPEIQEPPLEGEIRDTVYDHIQLPAVIIAHRTVPQGTPDSYALFMLGQVLSQGQSSRLHKKLVEEEQKSLFAGSFPLDLEDAGVNLSFSILNLGADLADVERIIIEEIEKLQTALITEREFQKLQNQVENNFISANTSLGGIAESLANYHLYFGDANLINTELNRYLSVTREDLLRVARKYFQPDNRVVLYYMPQPASQ